MARKGAATGFARRYRVYVAIMAALGYEVDQAAVAEYLGEGEEQRAEVEKLLKKLAGTDDGAEPVGARIAGRMKEMEQGLLAEVRGSVQAVADEAPQGLLKKLRVQPQEQKDAVADSVLLNGHRRFLKPRYVRLGGLRKALGVQHDPEEMALTEAVVYLREELEKRGYAMSDEEIRQLFEPGGNRRLVPDCLRRLLPQAIGRFHTGLIPLKEMVGDEEPSEWLEAARCKLLFRSHSAMHKAIAEATNLKYDCVHKALSGRQKAKRIQAEIRYCLQRWLKDVEEGGDPDVSDEYRGVPIEQTQALLPQLERQFGAKEEIYRVVSQRTGIKTGSVRRYFQSNGQLKYAPLAVYRWAQKLAGEKDQTGPPKSYLADSRTRAAAFELARRTNEAFKRWRSLSEDADLELGYRELRRALIVAIKEQRHTVPLAV